jgi:hypothetical protein
MNITEWLKANIKPFSFHILVIIICGVINMGVWGNGIQKEYSFIVFIISLCLYFLFGLFLNNANSLYKNIGSVLLIPIFSLLLYLGVLIPEADFFFEFLYFGTIQPFLAFTGIPADFNHPIFFAFTPALLLWLALQTKVIARTLSS